MSERTFELSGPPEQAAAQLWAHIQEKTMLNGEKLQKFNSPEEAADVYLEHLDREQVEKVVKNLIETVVLESESEELDITDNMVYLLNNIKTSIKTQLSNLNDDLYEGITGEEMIELAVKEHQENLSYIDDVIEEKLKSSSN